MTTSPALLITVLVVLVATVRTAPPFELTSESSFLKECPSLIGLSKFAYQPKNTYSYSYDVKSVLQLDGEESSGSHSEWSVDVDLTWLSPCDMAIQLKALKVDGRPGPAEDRPLEMYPMVVSTIDGRVQHVYSHPRDEILSINIKKGVASILQNSLPSFLPAINGLNITEIDVVGNCLTKYTVQGDAQKTIIKEKAHHLCHERYLNSTESAIPLLQAILPMEEANTECRQVIRDGIYNEITCRDKNVIRPNYGGLAQIIAIQESVLKFKSQRAVDPSSIIIPEEMKVPRPLRFDYDRDTPREEAPLEEKLKVTVNQLCKRTNANVEADAAPLIAETVRLLRILPPIAVERTLQNIKTQKYESCTNHRKAEKLFLDAIAFVFNSGAVKLMVKELIENRAEEGRIVQYTAAFHLHPRPSRDTIVELVRLFQATQPIPAPLMAAASMVKRYCLHHPTCAREPHVRNIVQALNSKLQGDCSASSNPEQREVALATLKAMGNMGVLTQEASQTLLKCLQTEGAEVKIRVAAAQAFRLTSCDESIQARERTETLVNVAVDPHRPTEVRIESYLMAMRCAHQRHVDKIVYRISEEENTQVRGFILGHMMNLQQSNAPDKKQLRYLLKDTLLPRNITFDFRRYSRNLDLSYFAQRVGVGAGIESNVIYAPASFIPRSVDVNMTAALQGIPVSIAEIGARFEALEPIIEAVFGPNSYLQKAGLSQILSDLSNFVERRWSRVIEFFHNHVRQRRSIDPSVISSLINNIYGFEGSKVPTLEVFARLMGQEIAFASVDVSKISVDSLAEAINPYIDAVLNWVSKSEVDSVRSAQIYADYVYPTIQGTAFKLKLEGTAVAGLKKRGNIWASSQEPFTITPAVSVETVTHVGYESYIGKIEVRMNNTLSSNADASVRIRAKSDTEFEVKLDLPPLMDLIHITHEVYIEKNLKGQPEARNNVRSGRDNRVHEKRCYNSPASILGYNLCYSRSQPGDYERDSRVPSVSKLFMEKSDPSIRGCVVNAGIKDEGEGRVVKVSAELEGGEVLRKTEVSVIFNPNSFNISAKMDSPTVRGEVDTNFFFIEQFKSAETIVNLHVKEVQIYRRINAQVVSKLGMNENEIRLDVRSSNNPQFSEESKVAEGRLIEKVNGAEVSVQVIAKTMNALRRYVQFHLDVESDLMYTPFSPYPYPTNLRKFELEMGVGKWAVNSFLHKRDPLENKHTSMIEVEHRDQDMPVFEAKYTTEERPDRHGGLKTAVVKMGDKIIKARHEVDHESNNRETSLTVTSSERKVVDVKVSARHDHSYSTGIMVDLPVYIFEIHFEGKLAKESDENYALAVDLEYGGHKIVQVNGPIVVRDAMESYKLRCDLKVALLAQEPHSLTFDVSLADREQRMLLEVRRQEQIVHVDWNMKSPASQPTILNFRVIIPSVIDNQITVTQGKVFHVTINSLVLPQSQQPLRIKSYVIIDFIGPEMTFGVTWDVDNEQRKIAFSLNVKGDPSRPRFLSISGKGQHQDQWHEANIQINDGSENNFKLEVKTPSQQSLAMAVGANVEEESSALAIRYSIDYIGQQNRKHEVKGITKLQKLDAPYSSMIESEMEMKSPDGQETKVNFEGRVIPVPESWKLECKVTITNPRLRRPLHVHVVTDISRNDFKVKVMSGTENHATVFLLEMGLTPQGGVRSFIGEIHMVKVDEILEAILELASINTNENAVIRSGVQERKRYRVHYHKPSPSTHSVLLQYPSRTVQAEAHFSPSQSRLTVYPNREESDVKYEVGIESSHSLWRRQTSYQGHVSYPGLARDVMAEVRYTANEGSFAGTVTLDVFSDPADQIKIVFASTAVSEHRMKIEGNVETRVLKVRPEIMIDAAFAPSTWFFNITFRLSPRSPEAFQITAQFDRLSSGSAIVDVSLATQRGPVVNISAVVEPRLHGWNIESIAHAPEIGTYDISSKVRAPAFIELKTMRRDSEKQYAIEIGSRNQSTIGFTISEGNKRGPLRRLFALPRIELVSPKRIIYEMKYDRQPMEELKNAVYEEWQKITQEMDVWLEAMKNEAIKEGIRLPSSAILKILREVRGRLWQIIHYIFSAEGLVQHDVVRNVIEGSAIDHIKDVYSNIEATKEFLHGHKSSSIKVATESIGEIANVVDEAVREIAQWLETGNVPEEVRHLQEILRETSIFHWIRSQMDFLRRVIPEEYEAIERVCNRVVDTVRQNVEMIRRQAVKIPEVQRVVDWMARRFRIVNVMQQYLLEVVENAMLVDWRHEENRFVLNIPVHIPVYSLTQALQKAVQIPIHLPKDLPKILECIIPSPVQNAIWAYYALLPSNATNVIPPMNGTALVVGDSEILTFDGTVLRIPRTPCEILLASYKSNKVILSSPRPSAPSRVVVIIGGTNVTVEPDFTVFINGKVMRGNHVTVVDVTVQRTPQEIWITSPYITIRILRNQRVIAVEVSGWTFGRVAGLLGTYDGEVADDWLMSSGRRASSLQELVKSWQEDPSCRSPAIAPIVPSVERMAKCVGEVGLPSRCHSIVPPYSFIELCYGADGAYEAYRVICSNKGVELME